MEERRFSTSRTSTEDQTSAVWFWGEELWLEALGLEERSSGKFEGVEQRRCGGRKKKEVKVVEEDGAKFVDLNPDFNPDMEIQAQVEEWLEAHLVGDKAASTQRAYQAAWQKWCDWSRRQGWMTPYLDHKGARSSTRIRCWATSGTWVGWELRSPR